MNYVSFKEAKKFMKSLNFKNIEEYIQYTLSENFPTNIPRNPTHYKEFKGFKKYLGLTDYLKFEQALSFVHSLKLKNRQQWVKYCNSGKKPQNIPSIPELVYPKKYTDIYHWLGATKVNHSYLPFEEARGFVRELKLKNFKKWRKYVASGQKPQNIPTRPSSFYNEFTSWNDFLGNDKVKSKKTYLSYEDAKAYVHSLNLSTMKEWFDLVDSNTLPLNIPKNPRKVYKKEFKNLADFIGISVNKVNRVVSNIPKERVLNITKKKEKIEYLSYEDAKRIALSQEFKNYREFKSWSSSVNRPRNFPSTPHKFYKNEFTSYVEFLNLNKND